ncbi:MAG: DJ-1/PfpI family protein [Pseudomonadota bacterium]
MRTVAVLLFDDVEVLDFAGPFEVFGVAGGSERLYHVFTVAQFALPIAARNNLSVNPHYAFDQMPHADVLVLPGGFGTRREKLNPVMLEFVRERVAAAESVLSVCTGALLLAKAGLLRGLHATTHRGALAELIMDEPTCTVLPHARVVDNGKLVVSAGVAMGIDAALYTVAKHHGQAIAAATAGYMEYDWIHRTVDGYRIVRTDASKRNDDEQGIQSPRMD